MARPSRWADHRAGSCRVARLDDEGRRAVRVVTLTELRLGVNTRFEPGTRERALDGLDRLLAGFDELPVGRATAAAAADLIDDRARRGASLDDLHDGSIGAMARTEQRAVLTATGSHFERLDGVRVADWAAF